MLRLRTLQIVSIFSRFAILITCMFMVGADVSIAAADESAQAAVATKSDGPDVTADQAEYFREKVRPILESRCFECHGDQEDVEAELRLTSRKAMLAGGESGPTIVPSDPDRSLLIQAVRYEGFEMPPRSKMPDEEIEILVKWIQDGAPWPEDMESTSRPIAKAAFPLQERMASHWAWRKIERPVVPRVKKSDWPATDIDLFLLAKMEEAGIEPAIDADRRAILRRLYSDLIGLPPSIEQQDQFFNDPSDTPIAMEKVVDELLASPQFGERWGRHWLDLMRYAETLGHEFDYPLPYAWRYRDYVIRALNADVPYNDFVREHIAGDLMIEPRRNPELKFNESIIATAFWYLCEDKHAPVDVKAEEASRIDNQIDVFGKTFLGLTIACARCHDHKFDAITADDYYALSGFLQSSRRRVEWIDQHHETANLVESLQSAQSAAETAVTNACSKWTEAELAKVLAEALRNTSSSSSAETNGQASSAEILRSLLKAEKSKELSNPLSLIATLVQAPGGSSQEEIVGQWIKSRDEALAALTVDASASSNGWIETAEHASTQIAADLRSGLPQNWLTFGAAFTHGKEGQAATIGLESGSKVSDVTTFVGSASLSTKLRGQLHSPEFVLTHPEIQILAAGKQARVRLCIDGYVMNEFSELLFGGCRQPIDTDGEFRWIRIAGDVKRYIGHRCHLEFLDEGDGWFAVREVRLMGQPDESPVTHREICHSNSTLSIAASLPVDELVQKVATAIRVDPAWMVFAVSSGMISEEHQSAISAATNHWTQVAQREQPGEPVLVMCEGSGEDEYVFIRGSHTNRGPMATRHMLTALDAGALLRSPEGSGRMELADRVLADSNPFPARVAVNRVWQHLFGRGIVASSDNFGVLGEDPTHPELLDFLADDFRNDGWSIKRLIKRLVLTRAYRLSSLRNDLAEQKDPTNKWLHRFSIRRLEGEILRDFMLAVSGRLDLTMYGNSVPVHLTATMQGRGRPGKSGPLDGDGRRSIYQAVNRNFLNPFMLAFDTPQPATAISRRSASNVPAQALMLMNNEFVHQQSEVWANKLLKQPFETADQILQAAFRQAFCRAASTEEVSAMTEFATSLATDRQIVVNDALRDPSILAEVCHVLLNQKEFLFLD